MKLIFRGKVLKVKRAKMPAKKENKIDYKHGVRKLFVGALPSKLTLSEFRAYFEQFGEVEDVCLPQTDYVTGQHRGHGFVTFKDTKTVKEVIEHTKPHSIKEKFVS